MPPQCFYFSAAEHMIERRVGLSVLETTELIGAQGVSRYNVVGLWWDFAGTLVGLSVGLLP